MRFACVLAAVIAVSCGPGGVQAQSSGNIVPAEFPPASYNGRQYVDSKGCAFIRAGMGSAVTWVPRMSRKRKHICGFKPTLSASARAKATAPRATAMPAPRPSSRPAAVATAMPRNRAPATNGPVGYVSSPRYRTGPVRVAPKHVYESQTAGTQGIFVPDGYTPIWEDDRLNPRRGHHTQDGKARMDLVWTDTVPRRLIGRETGR